MERRGTDAAPEAVAEGVVGFVGIRGGNLLPERVCRFPERRLEVMAGRARFGALAETTFTDSSQR